jgi:hypothetical protein
MGFIELMKSLWGKVKSGFLSVVGLFSNNSHADSVSIADSGDDQEDQEQEVDLNQPSHQMSEEEVREIIIELINKGKGNALTKGDFLEIVNSKDYKVKLLKIVFATRSFALILPVEQYFMTEDNKLKLMLAAIGDGDDVSLREVVTYCITKENKLQVILAAVRTGKVKMLEAVEEYIADMDCAEKLQLFLAAVEIDSVLDTKWSDSMEVYLLHSKKFNLKEIPINTMIQMLIGVTEYPRDNELYSYMAHYGKLICPDGTDADSTKVKEIFACKDSEKEKGKKLLKNVKEIFACENSEKEKGKKLLKEIMESDRGDLKLIALSSIYYSLKMDSETETWKGELKGYIKQLPPKDKLRTLLMAAVYCSVKEFKLVKECIGDVDVSDSDKGEYELKVILVAIRKDDQLEMFNEVKSYINFTIESNAVIEEYKRQILLAAIKRGEIDVFEQVKGYIANMSEEYKRQILLAAIKKGNIDIFKQVKGYMADMSEENQLEIITAGIKDASSNWVVEVFEQVKGYIANMSEEHQLEVIKVALRMRPVRIAFSLFEKVKSCIDDMSEEHQLEIIKVLIKDTFGHKSQDSSEQVKGCIANMSAEHQLDIVVTIVTYKKFVFFNELALMDVIQKLCKNEKDTIVDKVKKFYGEGSSFLNCYDALDFSLNIQNTVPELSSALIDNLRTKTKEFAWECYLEAIKIGNVKILRFLLNNECIKLEDIDDKTKVRQIEEVFALSRWSADVIVRIYSSLGEDVSKNIGSYLSEPFKSGFGSLISDYVGINEGEISDEVRGKFLGFINLVKPHIEGSVDAVEKALKAFEGPATIRSDEVVSL